MRCIYQSKRAKACFQHLKGYGDFKDLTWRTASDKILCEKTFNIIKNSEYDWYQRGLALMVYKFFNEKISGSSIKNQ